MLDFTVHLGFGGEPAYREPNRTLAHFRGNAHGTQHGRKRDLAAVDAVLQRARARFGLAAAVRVISCYEAGRDGFWIHRALAAREIENRVVDSSSIEVNRRKRRAKSADRSALTARRT